LSLVCKSHVVIRFVSEVEHQPSNEKAAYHEPIRIAEWMAGRYTRKMGSIPRMSASRS
jgi:hypothetical protein